MTIDWELVGLLVGMGILVAAVVFYVWAYFLGGPCSGTVLEVPVWCL